MLNPEFLLRHTRPGPRYTSYPTAPEWDPEFPMAEMDAAIARTPLPATVYVHIPFCEAQCTYCGCNMVVAGRLDAGTRYLDALERRIDALALPAERIPVERIHLGGGTPTWMPPAQLTRLYELLYRRFEPVPGAEISVEADPEVTTDAQIDTLAELGVSRLSMGVQSFDPAVLKAVNRPQKHTRVHAIMARARRLGMGSMNLDLMYGLPLQTPASFADTLSKTLEMSPDRLAVFGYAHLPWLRAHMRRIDATTLPDPPQRMALFLLAHQMLTERGYQAIGMDHFALPDDELAVAQRHARLHRNFMGYTTRPDLPLIGLGMSAISELGDTYVQVRAKLSRWWQAIEKGEPLIEKGMRLSAEDLLRRDVISRLMCNFTVPLTAIEQRHGIDFGEHFAGEWAALAPLEGDGLVERHPDRIDVTDTGRLLVRNVAMVFDAYLGRKTGRRFSQTV